MNNQMVLNRKMGIMTADMNGATVMLDIESGKYFNLGEIGGRIWEILEQPTSVKDLVSTLVQEYDVTEEQCLEDIVPFLEKMLNRGLVVEYK